MKNEKKTCRVIIRMTKADMTFLECTARVYAEGNLSEWMRYCIRNYQPKYIKRRPSVKKAFNQTK